MTPSNLLDLIPIAPLKVGNYPAPEPYFPTNPSQTISPTPPTPHPYSITNTSHETVLEITVTPGNHNGISPSNYVITSLPDTGTTPQMLWFELTVLSVSSQWIYLLTNPITSIAFGHGTTLPANTDTKWYQICAYFTANGSSVKNLEGGVSGSQQVVNCNGSGLIFGLV